jgi:predicted XRE-type DNA-binding protein
MTKFPSEKELKEARKALSKGIATRPLPKDASPVEQIKFKICEQFVQYKNAHRLTQRELAEKIEIDEALMSKILHYIIDDFTTDRLLRYLAVLYPKVQLEIKTEDPEAA